MKILVGPLICILMLFSVSCSKTKNSNERVLNLFSRSDIKGMDPIYSDDRYSSLEISRTYEGLFEYHYLKRPYTLIPNLAESMPTVSKDGLTYTVKIKSGVTFHDDSAFAGGKGREMVAEDFVFSIKRLADPKLLSTGWWVLDGKIKGLNEWRKSNVDKSEVDYSAVIDGVQAIDKYTLQFKLTKPFPQFLYSLAMPFTYVVAKEVVAKYGKEFLNHPIGTGPFILPQFKQTKRIEYLKNPHYREKYYPSEGSLGDKEKGLLNDAGKKLPLVDKVVVHILVEDQPRWLNFQKGNLDLLKVPKDNHDSAITPNKSLSDEMIKKGFGLHITPSLDVTFTSFNFEDPLLGSNINLRRAMLLAYDAAKANVLFYSNDAMVAQSVIPPGIAGNDENYKNPFRGPNLKLAKEYLKKAGFPEGNGLAPLRLEISASTTSRQIGEFFAKSMAEIGIKIQVNSNTWPELQKKVKTRTAQLFNMAWSADYPDAENFLQLLYGPNKAPGSNGSNYDDPEFNRLFLVASQLQDSPERTALYEKLNRMAAEVVPWVFGVHRMWFELTQSWLKNFKHSEFDWGQEKYLNVDLAVKKVNIKKL